MRIFHGNREHDRKFPLKITEKESGSDRSTQPEAAGRRIRHRHQYSDAAFKRRYHTASAHE